MEDQSRGATALGGWVCGCGLFGAGKHISTRSGVLVALQVPPQNRSSGTRGLAVAPPGMTDDLQAIREEEPSVVDDLVESDLFTTM